jgi:hypothetical protein
MQNRGRLIRPSFDEFPFFWAGKNEISRPSIFPPRRHVKLIIGVRLQSHRMKLDKNV